MKKPHKKADKNCHKYIGCVKIWQTVHNNNASGHEIANWNEKCDFL